MTTEIEGRDTAGIRSKREPEMPDKPVKPIIAVFGGSFDPVHNGHLFIAGSLLRLGLAHEVMMVPAGDPPHKPISSLASARHRLAMLELAVEPYPGLSVSDIELKNGNDGPCYTISTMEMLDHIFNDCEVRFVLGMDSLHELHQWFRAGELVSHYNFFIYPRPQVRVPSYAELSVYFGPRNARKLLNAVLDLPGIPVSATYVRQTIERDGCLSGLIGDGVTRYLREHKLYRMAESV